MKKTFLAAISLLALTACSEIPGGTYFNRGDPENLLDSSSEVISLTLATPSALNDLTTIVSQDPPTRAELGCSAKGKLCSQAKAMLDKHGVPSRFSTGDDVTLVYDRVLAHDCENRYINNAINPYNLNHPTFGCSVTANTVQQVSDRRQFSNPSLMDLPDGEKTVQNYQRYQEKPQEKSFDESSKSALSTISD